MRNIDKKYHYLYKTTNILNDKYYYGIHSTNNLEDGYLGSGKRIKYSIRKYGKDNFKKEIIEYFNTRDELALAENKLITKDMLIDKYCMNISFGGYGGTLGRVNVKDKTGNAFSVFVDDVRYLSGELIPANKGLIMVKDIHNKTYSITKDEPRYLSGELISCTVGKVVVKDKEGNLLQIDKTDSRYLSGEFIHHIKDKITVKDKYNNNFWIDKNDERYLNGELVGIWKDRKHKDETKKKMAESSKGMCKGELNGSFGTCWITKDNENKKIKKEELENYLSLNWIKGRKLK